MRPETLAKPLTRARSLSLFAPPAVSNVCAPQNGPLSFFAMGPLFGLLQKTCTPGMQYFVHYYLSTQ